MLKPKKINIQFGYECPVCGSDYWFDFEELKVRGIGFPCCNQMRYPSPIRACRVIPTYGIPTSQEKPTEKSTEKKKPIDKIDKDNILEQVEEVCGVLRALGFKITKLMKQQIYGIAITNQDWGVDLIVKEYLRLSKGK